MHARRIRRQHRRKHRRLRLVAHRDAAAFFAIAAAEDLEIEPAREALQNLRHVLEHERILRHVRAAHVLGQAGAGRLLVHEIVRRLRAVAHRQRAVLVEIGRLAEHRDQLVGRKAEQGIASLLCLPHVALDDPADRLAHLGNRLAGREVIHLGDFERVVRLAPADDGKFDHDVASASCLNKRRPSSLRPTSERPRAADAVPWKLLARLSRVRLRRAPGSLA